jgi:hypothetical protein
MLLSEHAVIQRTARTIVMGIILREPRGSFFSPSSLCSEDSFFSFLKNLFTYFTFFDVHRPVYKITGIVDLGTESDLKNSPSFGNRVVSNPRSDEESVVCLTQMIGWACADELVNLRGVGPRVIQMLASEGKEITDDNSFVFIENVATKQQSEYPKLWGSGWLSFILRSLLSIISNSLNLAQIISFHDNQNITVGYPQRNLFNEGIGLDYTALMYDDKKNTLIPLSGPVSVMSPLTAPVLTYRTRVIRSNAGGVSGGAFSIESLPFFNECVIIESAHNYDNNAFREDITFPNAKSLRIVFDKKCRLASSSDHIKIYNKINHSEICDLSGTSAVFKDITTPSNSIIFSFLKNSSSSTSEWGFKAIIFDSDRIGKTSVGMKNIFFFFFYLLNNNDFYILFF